MHNWQDNLVDRENILHKMISVDRFGTYFGVSQEIHDQVWGNLTAPDGNSVIYVSMEIGADIDVFHPIKKKLQSLDILDSTDDRLDQTAKKFLSGPGKIPNYSGGLGILAGDTLKSFADCKIPAAAISLLYKKGYFSQLVDSRIGQIAWEQEWDPARVPGLYLLKNPSYPEKPLIIEVPFFDQHKNTILSYAQIWLKMEINENLDFFVPELLLDYSTSDSPEWIRDAASQLYDSSSDRTKALQRRMLGAGIMQIKELLGLTAKTLHLNEQHGVIATLHLIADDLLNEIGPDFQTKATDTEIIKAAEKIAQSIVYTIHTPVRAGHDRYNRSIYASISHTFCQRVLNLLAIEKDDPDTYNFTALAMKINRTTNSVSRLHKEVTRQQFPNYSGKLSAVTNGVHHLTWISDAKAGFFDCFPELRNWRQDPGVFARAEALQTNKKFRAYLEKAWLTDTKRLIEYVNEMLLLHRKIMHQTWIDPPNFLSNLDEEERRLSPSVFTIGFARRFSTYKRADLIFENIDLMADILVSKNYQVNFLFAGKAHPADEPGKWMIKLILDSQKELYKKTGGLAKLIFITDYDMSVAKLMVAGVHAWLNSPKRPLEASGTSGMKAAMNGVPNISIMDGWWAEGYHNGQTGWKFGHENTIGLASLSEHPNELLYTEDSASFYEIFPEILDAFYKPEFHDQFLDKCIMNLVLNTPIFNTHRMAAEYKERYEISLPPQVEKNIQKFRKLYNSDVS